MRAFLTRFQLGKDKQRQPPSDPDVHKKVAFISPPQSPVPAILDRDLPLPPQPEPVPAKSTVSRFHAAHPDAPSSRPPYQRDVLSPQSFRSATPYSTMSAQTSGSRILAAASWSELTEDDLVSNIGSRERTRQEVLFEIISSEERYVHPPSPISPLCLPATYRSSQR